MKDNQKVLLSELDGLECDLRHAKAALQLVIEGIDEETHAAKNIGGEYFADRTASTYLPTLFLIFDAISNVQKRIEVGVA